jgi:hypothetical protein
VYGQWHPPAIPWGLLAGVIFTANYLCLAFSVPVAHYAIAGPINQWETDKETNKQKKKDANKKEANETYE